MKKITIIDGVFHEEEVPDNSPFDGEIIRKRRGEIVSGGGLFEQLETGRASSPYTPLTTERLENLLRDISSDTPEPYDTSLVEEMRQYSDDYNLNQLRMENAIRQSTIVTDQMIRETITAVFDENPLPQIYTGAAGQRAFDEAMREELARSYPLTPSESYSSNPSSPYFVAVDPTPEHIDVTRNENDMPDFYVHRDTPPTPETRTEIDPEITTFLTDRRNENRTRTTRRNNRPS
mgnify:CR=1 FL=1